MATKPVASPAPDLLGQLEEHLASQVVNGVRLGIFDMDDGPEAQLLGSFPELKSAVDWLEDKVTKPWRAADAEALKSQSDHRLVARIAISFGTAAIILAIAHLPIEKTATDIAEVFVALAALIAVTFGLRARFDRRWLGERNRAERLRMLKFCALVQFCANPTGWRDWVNAELDKLQDVDEFTAVEAWSRGGDVDPEMPRAASCEPNSACFRALVLYYRFKRIQFQANYFQRRCEEYQRQVGGWRLWLDFPALLLSVLLVLAHAAAKSLSLRTEPPDLMWKQIGVWCVAFAAMIPVAMIGLHAWISAFELPRSASLFAAKHRALMNAAIRIEQDSGDALATLAHMCHVEHFLEHEHREWLRLLLDTKWFI